MATTTATTLYTMAATAANRLRPAAFEAVRLGARYEVGSATAMRGRRRRRGASAPTSAFLAPATFGRTTGQAAGLTAKASTTMPSGATSIVVSCCVSNNFRVLFSL